MDNSYQENYLKNKFMENGVLFFLKGVIMQTRNCQIIVKVTQKEKQAIKNAAKEKDVSLSDFVRYRTLKDLNVLKEDFISMQLN